MPRKPRIHIPGGVCHVVQRGVAQSRIFADDRDRRRFLELSAEGLERSDHREHAFCLMDNHYHLAVQVGTVPLSKPMHDLGLRDMSEARAVAAYSVRERAGGSLSILACEFRRDESAMRQGQRRVRRRLDENSDMGLSERIEQVSGML